MKYVLFPKSYIFGLIKVKTTFELLYPKFLKLHKYFQCIESKFITFEVENQQEFPSFFFFLVFQNVDLLWTFYGVQQFWPAHNTLTICNTKSNTRDIKITLLQHCINYDYNNCNFVCDSQSLSSTQQNMIYLLT